MCRNLVAASLAFAMIGAVCNSILADNVPQIINYQGRLRNSDGSPVADGTYTVKFTIYDAASAGNVQWTETYTNSISVAGGTFHVLLGDTLGNPIGASVFLAGVERWLGIKVGTNDEMSPRQKIASVPYALRADTVSPGSIANADVSSTAAIDYSKLSGVAAATHTHSGTAITSGAVAVANGGTGATTAAGALTNLGAAAMASPTFTGTPAAPTPVTSDSSTRIPTTAFVHAVVDSVVPVGTVVMWYRTVANIPAGWHLCDGTTEGSVQTPDLRDKFVVGAKQDDSGVAKTNLEGTLKQSDPGSVKITTSHLPTHTHAVPDHVHAGTTDTTGSAHAHTMGHNVAYEASGFAQGLTNTDQNIGMGNFSTSSGGAHTHTFTTDSSGACTTGDGGFANSNYVMPYYALCYIIRVQ